VLDCTSSYGFIAPGYYGSDDPESMGLFKSGWPGQKGMKVSENEICAPCSYRTVAEEYVKNEYSYQYTSVGGLSWSIPYVAGVCALGWQMNPNITAPQMKSILLRSAYLTKEGVRVINPEGVVAMAGSKYGVAPVARARSFALARTLARGRRNVAWLRALAFALLDAVGLILI
jgi:serine protease AprX